jgi:hypothetical protein
MRTVTLAAVALLLLAPPPRAQADEGPALKELKATLKSEVKAFKAQTHDEVALAKADCATFDDAVKTGGDPLVALDALFDAVTGHLDNLLETAAISNGNGVVAYSSALMQIAGGAPLDGNYPAELYLGHDGLLDGFRADVEGAGDKAVAQIAKRVRKSLDKAEKLTGLSIGLRLVRDGELQHTLTDQTGTVLIFPFEPFIDLVLSAGDPEVTDDSRIWAAGWSSSDSAVEVQLWRDDEALDSVDVNPTGSKRWKATFTDLRAGNYVIAAVAGGGSDDAFQAAGIGAR